MAAKEKAMFLMDPAQDASLEKRGGYKELGGAVVKLLARAVWPKSRDR